ncbi:MAG: CoA-binding protein [Deltaproteobacteria bacterium]|nr:CoA-binding protein [Deltaproteobacteria bacterium]
MFTNPPDDVIRALLSRRLTIAVVGCSPDPKRDSYRIAQLLLERGHRVLPVNPNAHEILGQWAYPDLRALPRPIDLVDVFRRSEHVGPIVDDAIAIGAAALWLQLGVIDEAAAARARRAGLTVIMDRCPAIEYQRLLGP